MSHTFVGVDIGSSGTKAVLVDESGSLLASARTDHEISRPRPDWAEMDAERDWWGTAVEAVRQLLAQPGVEKERIAGVGVCGVGASFVPVAADGKALRPAILYGIDNRAADIVSALKSEIREEPLLSLTGRLLSAQSVGPKLCWLREQEPEVWEKTRSILTPPGLVAQRLGGAAAIDYHAALSFDPLFDATRMDWNDEFCSRLLAGKLRLPKVMQPGACVGRVNEAGSRMSGLPVGTSIACGTADVVAEAAGAGLRQVGDLLVMYGSTLFLVQRVDSFAPSPPLWPSYFLASTQPTLLAGTSNAGSLLAWFEREFAQHPGEMDALLEKASELRAGADGLLCLPYFSGERAPIFDPLARGLFLGLSGQHTRVHILRALVEGISFSFRHVLETFASSGHPPRRLLASGGGLRHPLWAQTMSDVVGLPQTLTAHVSGAALGAAHLGAQAAGFSRAGESIPRSWTAGTTTIAPDLERRTHYDWLYAVYLRAYAANKELMHMLSGQATP